MPVDHATYETRIAELEKANRILQKKLQRAESDQTALEATNERKESLLRKVIQQMKAAEMTQRESQQRLKTLMSNLPGMAYSCVNDSNWTMRFLSEGCLALTGYPVEAFLDSQEVTYGSLIHPEDQETVWAMVQEAIAQRQPFHLTYRLRTASGAERWVWEQGQGCFSDYGELLSLEGFVTDITERRVAELELRASEEKFKSLLASTPGVFYRCHYDADWTMEFISESVLDLCGYPADDFLQQTRAFGDVIHPEDTHWLNAFMEVAIARRKPYSVEYRIIHADGSIRWVYERGRAVFDDTGEVLYLDGTMLDVTERAQLEAERKAAEAQLKTSKEFLNVILDNVSDPIFVKDEQHRWVHVNKALCDLIAQPREAVIGKSDYDFFSKEQADVFWEKDAIVFTSNTAILNEEYLTDTEGNLHFLSTKKVCVKTFSGEKLLVGVIRDLSDRKQIEDALRESEMHLRQQAQELEVALQEIQRTQSQLIQSEKMSSLGQLVAGVAHEINNPTSFIYGNLNHANGYITDLLNLINLYRTHYPNPVPIVQSQIQAIDLDFVQEDLPKLLNSMQMGAERIKQIVLSLRTFSRMDEAEYKAVDIHEGIQSTLMILESRIKAQHNRPAIQVIQEYEHLPLVECYAGQLNQVFMNILVNAIDAIDEWTETQTYEENQQIPSKLTIQTRRVNRVSPGKETEWVEVAIADNGPGIPEAVRLRLFDPFFTTKAVGKGTGMGLSISYQIITEKHSGMLTCHSSAGAGATFVITIPVRQVGQTAQAS